MKYRIALWTVMMVVWLLWSGHYTPLLVTLGALSSLFVVQIAHRMGIADDEGAPIGTLVPFLLYAPWLGWEIVKSNLDVARRILGPSSGIAPRLIRVKTSQRSDLGRTIYANSITLTPGTVSVDLQGDEIVVHALTPEAAEGVAAGEMDRRVTRLEGSS